MKAVEVDDGLLMHAFLSGDQEAFARLYDRYDRQCFQFIRRVLGPSHRHAAEDVHQDTWMAAASSGASYDQGKAAFGTWLMTIARNKVMDHLRRQKVAFIGASFGALEHEDDARVEVEEVPDLGPTPADLVESAQLASALLGAVDALPLSQREVFVMFAVSEMTLAEIAEATQVGVETAKSRLRYARAALRMALATWRPVDA